MFHVKQCVFNGSKRKGLVVQRERRMMSYWMMVCSPRRIEKIDGNELLNLLRQVNHQSLCQQYGLDPALIPSALRHLNLSAPTDFNVVKYFLLKYRPDPHPPLVFECSFIDGGRAKDTFLNFRNSWIAPEVREEVEKTCSVISIVLTPSQLKDMGILFAYEAARWILGQAGGVLRGLDGSWYRLNRFSAFLKIER